uniref:Superoxide dismutase n=1 Tax=Pyramimonas obovata TaxID=1411642 RepID=A0A7S0R035_9CHLO|eukprot:CAMPEP_0118931930 /NCGR_PEP_ID=MMETSP1169-20130426/8716_1 /TAXON_ID=36882 /ORGANISM="Pyramimonas obovata, Strain CCMP722" /LENGTH=228 /DNA_ID=CAMNT_0006874507 /DNA_START=82 /DNA_END=768 /DNA_ORIENTATION=-
MLRQACSSLVRAARPARTAAVSTSSRAFSTVTLPDLPYDYSALAPIISPEIMELHHAKHHRAYVTNFNIAYEKHMEAEAVGDLATMIALQGAIKFNGGGHVNHSMFWEMLCSPKDFELPSGDLAAAIETEFGSLEEMQKKFNAGAAAVQGSGWGWLGYNKATGKLALATTANQDPCSTTGLVPLLGVDVWEHAYYLQYKNVRPDYLTAVWNVVNWKDVASRYAAANKA